MIRILFLLLFCLFASNISFAKSKNERVKVLNEEIRIITQKINKLDSRHGHYIEIFSRLMHQLFLAKTTKLNKAQKNRKWDQEIFHFTVLNENKQVILESEILHAEIIESYYYLVTPGISDIHFAPILIYSGYKPIIWYARPAEGGYDEYETREEQELANRPDIKKLEKLWKKLNRQQEKINRGESVQKKDVERFSELMHQWFLRETIGWSKARRDRAWKEELFYAIPLNANRQVILTPSQYNQLQYYLIYSRMRKLDFGEVLIHKEHFPFIWSGRQTISDVIDNYLYQQ